MAALRYTLLADGSSDARSNAYFNMVAASRMASNVPFTPSGQISADLKNSN